MGQDKDGQVTTGGAQVPGKELPSESGWSAGVPIVLGASGDASSSLLTNLFNDDPEETAQEKEVKRSLIGTLVGGRAVRVGYLDLGDWKQQLENEKRQGLGVQLSLAVLKLWL